MKKIYSAIIMVSACLLTMVSTHAQNTVTIDFTGMDPHVGQSLFFRVVDVSDGSEVGRTSVVISSADFSLAVAGIVPGSSYNLDFYADFNENGKYDAPPVDHTWRILVEDVAGDVIVGFAHNTTFTDIAWVHQISLAFSSMNPHLGQDLYLALKDAGSGDEIERRKIVIEGPDFDVNFDDITPGNSYVIDFFADHNLNGKYDPPADDHTWRITLDDVLGDTTVPFIHNTTFTDIAWVHRITLAFSNMNPHVGQNLYLALKDADTGGEIERKKIEGVVPDFDVHFDSITPGNSYMIDFFADHNQNDRYDPPADDHTWRITIDDVLGDTTVPFIHNTDFTDIDWEYKLTVHFTGMTPHVDQDLKLYLRNNVTGAFLDTVEVSPITAADFMVVLFSILPDSSYNIDFFADFNENGEYDAPPADHAWRITLVEIQGDTMVVFAHNTDFTDIGLGGATGINDISDRPGFTTYPNPVRDQMTIKFDRNAEKARDIRIFNSTGTLVQQQQSSKNREVTLNVSTLKPGLYILDIGEGQDRNQVKFTKD